MPLQPQPAPARPGGPQPARPQAQIMIQEIWPTTLFLCDWPEQKARGPALAKSLIEEAKGYREPIASGVARSAKSRAGLKESPLNLFDTTTDPSMQALAAWIAGCVRAAVHKMNGGGAPLEKLRVEFTNSWFHVTNDGGFHDAHTHGNCSWCGIFYLDAGQSAEVPASGSDAAGNGVNRFYAPFSRGGMVSDYGNAYLRRHYVDVQPIDGRLVIFPSYLLHSALPYRGETDRVVLAFNSRTNLV